MTWSASAPRVPRHPRGGDIPAHRLEQIAKKMRRAAQMAADAGLVLGLENVRSCWANSGITPARSCARRPSRPPVDVGSGNCFVSGGDPNAEGYEAVRGRICLVHVKDGHVANAATGLTAWDPVGKGEVDWPKQFDLLRRDNYAGPLSLERTGTPRVQRRARRQSSRQPNLFEGIRQALAASPLSGGRG